MPSTPGVWTSVVWSPELNLFGAGQPNTIAGNNGVTPNDTDDSDAGTIAFKVGNQGRTL